MSNLEQASTSEWIEKGLIEREFLGKKLFYYTDPFAGGEKEQEIFSQYLGAYLPATDADANDGTPGRARIYRFTFPSGKVAVIRNYRRGGFAARFSSRYFFCWRGDSRPVREMRTLQRLFSSALPVPEPIACLVSERFGGLVYSGLIGTWEITGSKNMLSALLAAQPLPEASTLFETAGQIARRALELGIEHADLHVGNILFRGREAFLIDWDKARVADRGSAARIAERLARSVRKHSLERSFVEAFRRGLELR